MNLIKQEFIFDEPLPTPECHASTILKLSDGKYIASWFAGEKEGKNDVMIWISCFENGAWSSPRCITTEEGIPHWNPVLLMQDENTVTLFYKIGYKIIDWKTMVMTSHDGGKSWGEAKELIEGDTSGGRGPVKNKAIRISNGNILAPASVERGPWRCFIDIYNEESGWRKRDIPVIGENADEIGVIQPTLWESANGNIHALLRSNQGKIYRSDSEDYGETWSPVYPTDMLNNNSGIDCVLTESGKLVLVCNPKSSDCIIPEERYPISVYVSTDNGKTFQKELDLETTPGEYSYPAIIADKNRVYITYTWKRKKIVFCEIEI